MARSTLAGLVLVFAGLAMPAAPPPQASPQIKQAGVCSRCHVAQVLEWSAGTRHVSAGTTCQSCHGPSAGHVANERNQVKPDRLPQGDFAVAALCASCHGSGCPKTSQKTGCQSCHHPHALSNPDDRQLRQTAAIEAPGAVLYRTKMAEGERLASVRDWEKAREAFAAAGRARPNDRRAAARLSMAERRLHPERPGLEIVGDEFDPESGFPRRVRVSGLGMEMLLVPGGETDIGSDRWPEAQPVHTVYGEPFYLGKFEVTQKEWAALGMANPSAVKGDQLPVHGISWNDAQEWIVRLNRGTGGAFRMPTEAEWERAARPSGGVSLEDEAWFRANSAIAAGAPSGGFREAGAYAPRAVGLKRPNTLGFFDLRGNVGEWCSSLLRPYPYNSLDGREADTDRAALRAIRGGAFADSAEYLDPAFRHSERPGRRNPWVGMRLAR